ncbi:MAG TPA: tRNA lysidine(34) synthetase TilS, partial [Solimonas sp.]|nr:tRNA lysidine(34) synthetase TilS [Solimonas sp.]
RALHIHHGLQAAADGWARQVRALCRELGVPLTVRRVQVDRRHGGGPEAAARDARYAAFLSVLKPGDLLATAHHRDDQAETVLLRALRGSGIAGLAAMPALSVFGPGRLWRPLLDCPRAALQAQAQRRGLRWIDDPHNRDPRYARSYLRAEVMPRLAAHWPQAPASLARLAQRAADAEALAATLAQLDLQTLRAGAGWSVGGLLALDPVRRRNALYHAWLAQRWPAPAEARLARLDVEILRARGDAQPLLRHEHGEVRRFRDVLYLLPHLPPPPAQALAWPARRRELNLPDGLGRLRLARPPAIALQLRFARGGERLKPAGDRHTRSLKQLCQDRGIAPWVRVRMPLLYAGDELLAIAGGWHGAKAAQLGLRPRWETTLAGVAGTGLAGGNDDDPL